MFMRPTFRNVTDSFEEWAYRNGFHRKLVELEKRKLLESVTTVPETKSHSLERALRLTEAGRLQALGGRDPEARWNRDWDRHWRLVLFDIPNAQRLIRDSLRQVLQGMGFGWLQNSVWISPDPLPNTSSVLQNAKVDVESLVLLQARTCGGETDQQIVAGAWDFQKINHLYTRHMKVLAERPGKPLQDEAAAKQFREWAARERSAWMEAVSYDPLLPTALLPSHYLGRTAWRKRLEAMHMAAEQMRSIRRWWPAPN